MNKKFYITTTLPYVNADPHIGFALEIVQADVIARYHRLKGDDVFFNFGTDEHGQKVYEAAEKEGMDVQKYCDIYAAKFDALKEALNLSYNNFIRTTDEHHIKAAQEFWKRCDEAGDIYKKNYKIKYCVGCELERTDSELINGRCPLHPNKELEIIEEENYFFKFSRYQEKLLELYKKHKDFVIPRERLNEIKKFVEQGLQDFSISRLKEKMPWGVPVPGDETQVMYVWFDALVNYISAIGWPDDLKKFNSWWPAVQVAGKDNLRQQGAMWQAMLMSAGLESSKQIIIHGYVTNEGQKMSKSLGNVVNPIELAEKYGTDAVRYYLLKYFHHFEDSDFTIESFKAVYNADLANGLGNLVSRVSNMIEKITNGEININERNAPRNKLVLGQINKLIEEYDFKGALEKINRMVTLADRLIDSEEPWRGQPNAITVLSQNVGYILDIAKSLEPFLPDTSVKIKKQFSTQKIKKEPPLFPRL